MPLPPCQLQRVQQQGTAWEGRRNTLVSTRPFPRQLYAATLAPFSLLTHRTPASGWALGSHRRRRARPQHPSLTALRPPRPRPPRPTGKAAVVAAALTDARLQRLGLHVGGPRLLTGAAPLHRRPAAGPGAAAPWRAAIAVATESRKSAVRSAAPLLARPLPTRAPAAP